MSDEPLDADDDMPWASPEIRQSYEAALGSFILEFNQIDNLLSDILATVLTRLQKEHLEKRCTECFFSQKLLVLDLLKTLDGRSRHPRHPDRPSRADRQRAQPTSARPFRPKSL